MFKKELTFIIQNNIGLPEEPVFVHTENVSRLIQTNHDTVKNHLWFMSKHTIKK